MIATALMSPPSTGQNVLGHHDAVGYHRQWSVSTDDPKPCYQGNMYSFQCIDTIAANHSPYLFALRFTPEHEASVNRTALPRGVSPVLATPGHSIVMSDGDLQRIRNGSGG